MIQISPSVLSADFAHLGEDCRRVLDAGADMIHFDVMDGHFVDNISFGLPVLESLRADLPDAVIDVHLMLSHPLSFVKRFANAGANLITFHVETVDDVTATLSAIRALGCGTGLAVSPNVPVEAVYPWLDELTLVQVLGVRPGHGGQSFRPATLEKLRILRAEIDRRGLDTILSVDGGIKAATTAPQCIEAGANALVVGSALFQAEDLREAMQQFKAL